MGLTKIRGGKIIAVLRFVIEPKGETNEEILSQFLARQYIGETEDLPTDIFLENITLDDSLRQFFSGAKIELVFPQIGPKKELLDFTKNQVREYAYKRELETLSQVTLTRGHMENILQKLGYEIPKK